MDANFADLKLEIKMAETELKSAEETELKSPSEFSKMIVSAKIENLRQLRDQLRREQEIYILSLKNNVGAPESHDSGRSLAAGHMVWSAGSPSSSESVLTLGIAIVEEGRPIFWKLPGADNGAAASFAKFCVCTNRSPEIPDNFSARADRVRELFPEKNSYSTATSHRPNWSEAAAGGDARKLFGMAFSLLPEAMSCKPELSVRCSEKCVPGFNAELKTMGNKGLFDGAATYVALDMMRSFFTTWRSGDAEPSGESLYRFYDRPPLGFALCGAPPLGWIVSIEWIGRLFISAYSRPFFISSDEHVSVIQRLEKPEYPEPVDLEDAISADIWDSHGPDSMGSKAKRVSWTKTPVNGAYFYKIKTWDAVSPEFQKRTALAYAAYEKALENSGTVPAALVKARLLFGCARLAVCMPFVHGTSPAEEALCSEDGTSTLAVELAAALLWLAGHDLLYTDLRYPNVLCLPSGDVRLVDYDDMRVVEGLGRDVDTHGVDALTRAFADFVPAGTTMPKEVDFTQKCPGIRTALCGMVREGREAKRRRLDRPEDEGSGAMRAGPPA